MFHLAYLSQNIDREKIESLQESFKKDKLISAHTSGSTGIPKEISFELENMKASALATNAYFSFNEQTSALLALSTHTIAGKMMLLRAMEGNYKLTISTPTQRPLQNINVSLDFVAMVPTQLKETVEHDIEKLKSIRVILIGGGPISKELENELKHNKITIYHSFGMTETISHIAMRKVGFTTENFFEALPGVEFAVKSEKLVIQAPHIGVDGLETNDLVRLLSPSKFEWLGRADFVVNTGGYKIQIEALESRISSYVHSPFFLWKQAHEKWGEELVLCLEGKDSIHLDFSTLNIKSWEKPKKIFCFDKFIRSESGKIIRKATFDLNPIKVREKTL